MKNITIQLQEIHIQLIKSKVNFIKKKYNHSISRQKKLYKNISNKDNKNKFSFKKLNQQKNITKNISNNLKINIFNKENKLKN